jgi:hypothetical protein
LNQRELNEAETRLADAEAGHINEIYTAKTRESQLCFAVGPR